MCLHRTVCCQIDKFVKTIVCRKTGWSNRCIESKLEDLIFIVLHQANKTTVNQLEWSTGYIQIDHRFSVLLKSYVKNLSCMKPTYGRKVRISILCALSHPTPLSDSAKSYTASDNWQDSKCPTAVPKIDYRWNLVEQNVFLQIIRSWYIWAIEDLHSWNTWMLLFSRKLTAVLLLDLSGTEWKCNLC